MKIKSFKGVFLLGGVTSMFLAGFFFLPLGSQAITDNQPLPATQVENYVEGQVIVKFQSSTTEAEKEELRATLGARPLQPLELIQAEWLEITTMSVEEAVDRFGRDSRVEYFEPNFIYQLDATIPNDPFFTNQWGLNNTAQTGGTVDADIDAPEAWDDATGNPIVIGVIDTGVDFNHPDLAANMWVNPGEIPNNGIDDDNNLFVDDINGNDFVNFDSVPMDDTGHGTHVAGIIGAVGNNGTGVTGTNWNPRIMALKACDINGCTTAAEIQALWYAIGKGAMITNNSYGGPDFSFAHSTAIAEAALAGQLFIASAGNGGPDNIGDDNDVTLHFPSGYPLPNIISVAATTATDNRAVYSNFGAVWVHVGAPGDGIFSTEPNNNYGFRSGTSMASPMVASVASLVWSAHPGWTYTNVRDHIFDTVDLVPDLQGTTFTGGRVNAWRAVSQCILPASGDWTITSNCTIIDPIVFPENITIQSDSTLTIADTGSLDMNFSTKTLRILTGSRLLIKPGGALK